MKKKKRNKANEIKVTNKKTSKSLLAYISIFNMEWNDANKDLRTSIIKKQREIDGLFLRYDIGPYKYNSDMNIPKKMKALALKGMLQNFRLREQVNDSRDENFHQRNYIYELQDSIDVLTLKLNGCAKTKSQREFIRLRDSTYGYIHCIESLHNFHTPNGIIHLCLMYYDEYEVLKIVITELNSTTVTSHTKQYIRTLSAQDIASKQLETNIANKQLECIQINGIRFVYSSMHHAIFRYDENTLSWINDITPLDKLKFKLMQHREQDSLSVGERKCLTPPYIKPEYAITKTNTRLSHDDTAQTYNSVLSWNIAVDLCLNVDDMDEKKNLGESTDYLNILIRLDNYYDLIIENFLLRYDLGIICQDAMVINRIRSLKMCNDEMKNRVDEINVKAAKLFQRTTLENFELTEMVIELNDESKYLKNEIDELRNKYTENSLLLNELIKVELIVDKKVKQMLENDKFNMKVKYY
eukprot:253995_1